MLDSDYSDCFSCVAGMFALPLTRGRPGGGKGGGCLTFALKHMRKMAIYRKFLRRGHYAKAAGRLPPPNLPLVRGRDSDASL